MRLILNTPQIITNITNNISERVISIGGITFDRGMYYIGFKKKFFGATRKLVSGKSVQFASPLKDFTTQVTITTKQTHTISNTTALQLLNLINNYDNELDIIFNNGKILKCKIDILNSPLVLTPTHENSQYLYFNLKVLV